MTQLFTKNSTFFKQGTGLAAQFVQPEIFEIPHVNFQRPIQERVDFQTHPATLTTRPDTKINLAVW